MIYCTQDRIAGALGLCHVTAWSGNGREELATTQSRQCDGPTDDADTAVHPCNAVLKLQPILSSVAIARCPAEANDLRVSPVMAFEQH